MKRLALILALLLGLITTPVYAGGGAPVREPAPCCFLIEE